MKHIKLALIPLVTCAVILAGRTVKSTEVPAELSEPNRIAVNGWSLTHTRKWAASHPGVKVIWPKYHANDPHVAL